MSRFLLLGLMFSLSAFAENPVVPFRHLQRGSVFEIDTVTQMPDLIGFIGVVDETDQSTSLTFDLYASMIDLVNHANRGTITVHDLDREVILLSIGIRDLEYIWSLNLTEDQALSYAGELENGTFHIPPPLKWGETVKNGDGSIRTFSHSDAVNYCRSIQGRLPTPREWGQLLQSMGVRGVLDTAFPDVPDDDPRVQKEIERLEANNEFTPINRRNQADQTVIDFYYSNIGYWRLQADFGNNWFWSSYVNTYLGLAYTFQGDTGQIGYDDTLFKNAVRCVWDAGGRLAQN